MKHGLSIATAALGLAIGAAPVLAGDITQIDQTGRRNNAVIEQIASHGNNLAQVRQNESWGSDDGNDARLTQQAVGNASIDVHQAGHSMSSTVLQHDGSDLQALVSSTTYSLGHASTIEQSGHGARAWIEQNGSASLAEVVQQGWGGGNPADIRQYGDAHRAAVFQGGSGLSATITQTGGFPVTGFIVGNFATIRQNH